MVIMKAIRYFFCALFWIGMLWLISNLANAAQCREYSPEQERVLDIACAMGEPYRMCVLLMAMVEQESFDCYGSPKGSVCRESPADGDAGSYGVMQVQLTTALWMVGWEDTQVNRALMRDLLLIDSVSIEFGREYLLLHRLRGRDDMIRKYRGTGPLADQYLEQIDARIDRMVQCRIREWE